MQQQWLGYRVRGYERLRRYADRMHAISVTAAHRLMVLNFWAKHGLQAAMDAFGVSRRTLYNWRLAYKDSDGDTAALNNQSRAPKHLRQRLPWAEGVLAQLVSLRQQMPFTPCCQERQAPDACQTQGISGHSHEAARTAPSQGLCA
jgi:hypothetical protein